MASALRKKQEQEVVPRRVEQPRIEEMLRSLGNADPRIREAAAREFRSVRDQRAAGPLRRLLEDGDLRVRIAAGAALHSQGDSGGVPVLIGILEYQADPEIRRLAARALGNIGDRRAVAPLIAATRSSDRSLQAYAAEALGNIGDQRAGDALLDLAERARGRARVSALWASGRVGVQGTRASHVLIEALSGEMMARVAAAQALASCGDQSAIPALLENMDYSQRERDPDRRGEPGAGSYGVRNACVDAVVGIVGRHPEAILAVIGALLDRRENVRMNAAKALGRIGSVRATMDLIERVRSDRDDYVRMAAAEALGSIGDARAVPVLIERVGQDSTSPESARSIAAAADALGSLRDRRAFPALRDALSDRSEVVRMAAVRALGDLNDPRSVPALNHVLRNDTFPALRAAAALALGRIGNEEARSALRQALSDPHPSVPLAAQRALDLLENRR